MKNRKIDLILIVLIVGLFVTFLMVDKSRVQNTVVPIPSIPTPSMIESPIKNEVFPQKIEVNNYSYEGAKIKLGFIDAAATKDTLTLTLSITGIDFSYSPEAFSDFVCDPNVTTQEEVVKTFTSYEVHEGDPIQITYVYNLQGNTYQNLHAEMDWTIGPCGPDFDESTYTPMPMPLMTNYHFTFNVPVK